MSTLLLITGLCLGILSTSLANSVIRFVIDEEQQSNQFVGNVKTQSNIEAACPSEHRPDLRFEFRASSSDYNLFRLDSSRGVLTTATRIDRESICEYSDVCEVELDVKVSPIQCFAIIKVLITIVDINDNSPKFSESRITRSVLETSKPGTLIPIPSATDKDSRQFGIDTYELVTQNDDFRKFELHVTEHSDHTMDLNVALLERLNREETASYELKVVAYDRDTPARSGSIIVSITVTDVNDNAPRFDNDTYDVTVSENLQTGSVIIQVHASDPDEGAYGEVEYSFTDTVAEQYSNIFGINPSSGEVYVRGPIDYEETKLYQLKIQAKDKGESPVPSIATVRIHVRDVNDHAPTISINTLTESRVAEVTENLSPETFVAYVSVVDPDQGLNGNYTCSLQDRSGAFMLKSQPANEFRIETTKYLDRESQETYNVMITCTDSGSPSLTESQTLTIKVLDANDNPPVFLESTYHTTLVENNTLGAYILRVEAMDADKGENAEIRYSIASADQSEHNLVEIDPVTGIITANINFDYEAKTTYQFLLTAEDHGTPSKSDSASLELRLRDMNDEFPIFTNNTFTFHVTEGDRPDKPIGKISATDRDNSPFNQINYYIDQRSVGYDSFHIDESSGEISVTAPKLDREAVNGLFNLTVIANNEGAPSVQSTVKVFVIIDDINDNPPEIFYPTKVNDTVPVSNQLSVGHEITRIHARDPDEGNNAKLEFEITSGNPEGWFEIDKDTGAVRVAKSLTSIKREVFSLVITVSDQGMPKPLASICDLKIDVDSSLAASVTGDGAKSFTDNLMILLGVLAALLLVIFLIVIIIIFIRRHKKRSVPKGQQYNVRMETDKALNGSTKYTSDDEQNSNKSDTSMDTVKETKSCLKKEVQFNYDIDSTYTKPSQETQIYPVHPNLKEGRYVASPVPHVNYYNARHQPTTLTTGNPEPINTLGSNSVMHTPKSHPNNLHPGLLAKKYPQSIEMSQPTTLPHPYPNGSLRGGTTGPRYGSVGQKGNGLTQKSLEVHDMNVSGHTDMDSECSGTDSGRGPSEEGDQQNLLHHQRHSPHPSAPQRHNPHPPISNTQHYNRLLLRHPHHTIGAESKDCDDAKKEGLAHPSLAHRTGSMASADIPNKAPLGKAYNLHTRSVSSLSADSGVIDVLTERIQELSPNGLNKLLCSKVLTKPVNREHTSDGRSHTVGACPDKTSVQAGHDTNPVSLLTACQNGTKDIMDHTKQLWHTGLQWRKKNCDVSSDKGVPVCAVDSLPPTPPQRGTSFNAARLKSIIKPTAPKKEVRFADMTKSDSSDGNTKPLETFELTTRVNEGFQYDELEILPAPIMSSCKNQNLAGNHLQSSSHV